VWSRNSLLQPLAYARSTAAGCSFNAIEQVSDTACGPDIALYDQGNDNADRPTFRLLNDLLEDMLEANARLLSFEARVQTPLLRAELTLAPPPVR
jgi:hypothetical protein